MSEKEKQLKEIKVILLGDSGVGKTSIINRYINNKFLHNSDSTLGSNFLTKEIVKGNITYKLDIWDTSGQERYRSVTNLFIKGSNIVLLVYSIDSLQSFESLEYWYSSLKDIMEGDYYVLGIVGSKFDLVNNEAVPEEKAKAFAKEKNASFNLVSAKEFPEGIEKLFNTLLDELIKRNYTDEPEKVVNIDKTEVKKNKKKKCC